jgi:hypothetical protein
VRTAWFDRATSSLFHAGRVVFSLAIVALGVETRVCARYVTDGLGPRYKVIPVLPWLPTIPWLAYLFGAILVACGAGLLSQRTVRMAATTLGGLLLLSTIVLEVPKNAANIGSISLRTAVFEPLTLASLAWLLPGRVSTPDFLARAGRYLLALSLIVFGVEPSPAA